MLYRLYKLRYFTPVRFGDDGAAAGLDQARPGGRADTLFSALCTEGATLSPDYPQKLAEAAAAGALLLTDLMPYHGDTLYIPRPLLPPSPQASGKNEREKALAAVKRKKKINKTAYIQVRALNTYLHWLQEGDAANFDIADATFFQGFEKFAAVRVNTRGEEPLPYLVTQYRLGRSSGHYFVAAANEPEFLHQLDLLLEWLGYSGIGGKRSAGLGKFELAEDPIDMDETGVFADDAALYRLLTLPEAEWYMALSCLWPQAEEIGLFAEGYYSLATRSGFVNSAAYAPNAMKRNSVQMAVAGSCFKARAAGRVGNLAAGGNHPVYRYGKSLYVGLKP